MIRKKRNNCIANKFNLSVLMCLFFKQKNAGDQVIFLAKFNFINSFFRQKFVAPPPPPPLIILSFNAHGEYYKHK